MSSDEDEVVLQRNKSKLSAGFTRAAAQPPIDSRLIKRQSSDAHSSKSAQAAGSRPSKDLLAKRAPAATPLEDDSDDDARILARQQPKLLATAKVCSPLLPVSAKLCDLMPLTPHTYAVAGHCKASNS